jgi:NnrS protein/HsdM N-terminal domain
MFEQAFKNIDDVLWKEAGCTTELDYTEQTSWLLFLKYLDGLEEDKATEAALDGRKGGGGGHGGGWGGGGGGRAAFSGGGGGGRAAFSGRMGGAAFAMTAAALLRIAAGAFPQGYMVMLEAAGAAWIAAFATFLFEYAPMLLGPRAERS